jgi:hypothetical protein
MKDLIIEVEQMLNEYGYEYLSTEEQKIARDYCGYYDEAEDEQCWSEYAS